ncbi:MAG: RDD family protein [Actinomycetota bacterium]|nr:RDD family protein [Actinomycetota bacterium]
MSDTPGQPAPGWYYAQGDPANTQRYWDGSSWQGGPQPIAAPGGGNPTQNPIGYGVGASTGAVLGAPRSRMAARFIDVTIWIIIWILVSMAFTLAIAGGSGTLGSSDIYFHPLIGGVAGTLSIVAYETFLVANKGASLGKLVLGLAVLKEDGSPADVKTGFRRASLLLVGLVPILGFIIYLFAFVASLVMIFTDARNQSVWDKVAKTIVVKR